VNDRLITTFDNAPLEIIDGDRGVNYPRQDEFSPSDHCLFLNAGNVSASGFSFSNCAFITKEKDEILRKGKLRRNDVVLTTRGTVGNVAYFDDAVPFDHLRINSGMVILRAQPLCLDPSYLYLFVRSALFHSQVAALTTGSAQPQLPIRDINRIEIPIPPLEEQRAVASTLGALDDKIDLYRRMNETLEATARAIFKDWFVDFGPTRTKMEDRAPYLAPEIWSLFPDRLDNEGKPQGWEWSRLGQHVNLTKGKSYNSEELQDSRTALVTLKSFKRGGGYRRDGLKPFSGEFKPEQVVFEGEIVVAQTDVTQAAEVIGRPARVVSDGRFERLVASLDVAIIRPKEETYLSNEFLVRLMGIDNFTQHTLAYTTGTTVLHLGNNAIPSFQLVLPSYETVTAYSDISSSLTAQQTQMAHETDTLSAARDLLLPRLMSGEIRVKDAEKIAEAAQ
jgi:type I restriction enzyme S subunit